MTTAKAKPKASPSASDPIRPDYYRRGGIKVADIADAYDLGRWLSFALKYILRAGHKEPVTTETTLMDLEKTLWYVEREIARVKREAARLEAKS